MSDPVDPQTQNHPASLEPRGSPQHLAHRDPRDIRWYRPTIGERLKLMGWKNLLWIPPIGMLAILFFSLLHPDWWGMMIGGWKLALMIILLPLAMLGTAAHHAIRQRTEPFCIHCGYCTFGFPDGHRCPECGEPISHSATDEYRRDPKWFIERHKLFLTHPRNEGFDVPRVDENETRINP